MTSVAAMVKSNCGQPEVTGGYGDEVTGTEH